MKRWLLLAVTMMALLGLAAACSNKKTSNTADTPTAIATTAGETPQASTTPAASETPGASTVTVNMVEWHVLPDTASVPAGSVTFNVKDIGSEKHEFVLIKTDQPEGGLPALADGSADEAQLDVIDKVAKLDAGGSGTITANLAAGNYVLICNVVDTATGNVHYKQGMHAAFTVTP